ncbi:MAG: transporter substrate-binding domain-containing protein [Hyphomicrobiaceae bacterium]|nr:transporter substrate-binding domain-containing protein [Hyphomicrobiaceae bacterium]
MPMRFTTSLWGVLATALLLAWGCLEGAAQTPKDGATRAAPPRTGTPPPAPRASIRFLTANDFPPFNYLDEDNVLTGFNIDIARAICLEANVTCEIQVRPWADLVAALRKGEGDAIIASHRITPELLKSVDFTDRYYHTPARFAARRVAPKLAMTPEGLEGKRIGVLKGSAHEMYLKAFFRDAKIELFESSDRAREALAGGKLDLLFDDGFSLSFWLNGTMSKGCCEFRGGPFAEPRFFGDGIGIAIRRNDGELKSMINAALRQVRESGRAEELFLRYFPLKVY